MENVYIFLIIILLIILGLSYYRLTITWCRSQTCLVGKTALVTGGSSGIGYYTALDFAKRGARVILTSLFQREAEEARDRIIAETGNRNVIAKKVDMTSFAAVRALAEDITKNEERLDILVNNAGVGLSKQQLTDDGCAELIQVNYLSLFLLTGLLFEKLNRSEGARIVNVASIMAMFVININVDKIKTIRHLFAYNVSKQGVILFTELLAKKLQGTNVTVYSVHPGYVATAIWLRGAAFLLTIAKLFKSSEQGAQDSINASVTKGIEKYSGRHFSECRPVTYWNGANTELAERLWKKTEEIVNHTFSVNDKKQ